MPSARMSGSRLGVTRRRSTWPGQQLYRPDLASAADDVFERGQLFDADGAARVHFAGGNANFSAHAEFAAVCELGRGVVEDDG